MSNSSLVALGDIFEIARGGSPRPIDQYITDDVNGVNWIMIGDASSGTKYITETRKRIKREGVAKSRLVKPGDFLLTNSMSFGHPYILKTTGCIHDGWLVLSPKNGDIDPDYFYHLLGSEKLYLEFSRQASGTTVKNLNIDIVRRVRVSLPPLNEQRRVATILDKADVIRRKRRQAIDLMNDLLRSVFLEMFGDEEANGPFIPLCDAVEIVSGQVDPRVSPYSKMLLIGGENIEGGTGKLLNLNTAEEARAISGKYLFSSDCILYSKIRPYLNKVVLPDFSGICSADIYPIVPKKEFSKEFVAFALQTTRFLSYAESCSTRTSIPKINREDLGNYSLSMPSIEKQNKFSQIYTGTKRCTVSLARSEKEIENCFNALTSNIF